jgi:DNA polymerase-3 subunit epsilon
LTQAFQSSELFPEISIPVDSPSKAVSKRVKRSAVTPVVNAVVPDLDAAVAALEAHPDYRLLRRLMPCMRWPGDTGALVARVLLLDTETTGLDHSADKIIELALVGMTVDLVTGLPVGDLDVYDGLEDPGFAIPETVVGITGLRDKDVGGQRLDDARVLRMLAGADLIIAHNASFDRPFCESRFPEFREKAWACSFVEIDWKAQKRSSAKLESLAQDIGLFYDAHRAEMDCHALLAVLLSKHASDADSGLMRLLQSSKKSSFLLHANQAPYDGKAMLKARGYRWNPDRRVWCIRLADDTALERECDWLKANIYAQSSATLDVEKLTAQDRYSNRPGELSQRRI